MTPEPFRGKRNRSDYIEYIAMKIAEIKSELTVNVKKQSIMNTKNLLKIE